MERRPRGPAAAYNDEQPVGGVSIAGPGEGVEAVTGGGKTVADK